MARAREVATRTALGAGRARLARQFLAESVLLALGGGLLGLVIARWGMTVLIAVGSAKIPRAHEIALDWQVFAFLLLLCLATAVVFGLAPAIGAARADISTLTRESGGHATSSPTFRRLRDLLVVAEVALAFVLALGAAHVVVELNRLRHAESGMSPEDVMTFHMTPRVPDADYLHIEQRLTQLSRVVAAGWIQLVPLQNWGWEGDYRLRERPQDAQPAVELRTVSPGYFAALGVPIVAGRGPAAGDVSGNSQNILINTALARRDFAGENPIGRQTSRGTIVGVVGDVRQVSLDRPPVPEIYQPLGGPGGIATDLGLTLIVRAAGPRDELVARVRAIVREVNPTLAIFDVKPMTQVVEDSLWELNLYRWLIGLFAALALLLAVIGLYGVISYGVSARTRELAIRLALGSNQHRLARLVIGRGLLLTIAGLLVGGATSLVVFGLLPDRPLGASPGAALFAVIAALVVAVSLAAVAAPASRVLAMSPLTALRQD